MILIFKDIKDKKTFNKILSKLMQFVTNTVIGKYKGSMILESELAYQMDLCIQVLNLFQMLIKNADQFSNEIFNDNNNLGQPLKKKLVFD